MAADFQVIYLTTSERYDGVADAIVELPGPTALDDAAPPDEAAPPAEAAPDRSRPRDRDRPPRPGLGARVGRRRLRRRPDQPADAVFGVVLISQLVGMAIAFVLALLRAEGLPTATDIGWAVSGGILGGIGITALYRASPSGGWGSSRRSPASSRRSSRSSPGSCSRAAPHGRVVGIGLAIVGVVLVSR